MKSSKLILRCLFSLLIFSLSMAIGATTSPDSGVSFAAVAFSPILIEDGFENMGGFMNWVVFIPDGYIATEPLLPPKTAEMTTEQLVTLAGTFTFKDAKKPIFIECTPKTVGLKPTKQGEITGKSFNQKGEFFVPGASKTMAALGRFINNMTGRIIIGTPEGEQIVVGAPGLPCTIGSDADFGTKPADLRGYKFEFEADSFAPVAYLPEASRLNIADIRSGGTGLPVIP